MLILEGISFHARQDIEMIFKLDFLELMALSVL